MSDFIPFDIQVEIIKRLPVKSIIQGRPVCKSWRSLISSSSFIAGYLCPRTQPQRLLIRYNDKINIEERYVSVVDDETFGQQQFSPFKPHFKKMVYLSTVIGSSDGLLCVYGFYKGYFHPDFIMQVAVLWNPSIRKSVVVSVPNLLSWPYGTVLGFGVCPSTRDPKIVKITHITSWLEIDSMTKVPFQVEVFPLSSGCWKSPCSNNIDASRPRKSIEFTWSQVATGGFIHWLAHDRMVHDGSLWDYNLVVSFDLVNEEFREMDLPDRLAQKSLIHLSISALGQSLALFECKINYEKKVCAIWMIKEYGVPESCTKLFTIEAKHVSINILGFRKNRDLIIEENDDDESSFEPSKLALYESRSGHINNLGIYARRGSFLVNSYVETLLLLDQPNGRIYPLVASQNHGRGAS